MTRLGYARKHAILALTAIILVTGLYTTFVQAQVVNGGFETGDLTGWGGFDIAVTTGFGHTGDHCLVGTGDWGAYQSFDPAITTTDCYLSFWYQSGTGTPFYCVVEYDSGDSDSIGPLTGEMNWLQHTHPLDPTRGIVQITFLTPELFPSYIAALDDVEIICEVPPEEEPPVADFWESAHSAVIGTPIDFDASASYDPDGTIVLYEWDFDDDGVYDTTGMTTSHVYMVPGTYTVTLRVTDDDGLTDTATDEKTITLEIVIPELPFGTIMGLIACLTALAVFRSRSINLRQL